MVAACYDNLSGQGGKKKPIIFSPRCHSPQTSGSEFLEKSLVGTWRRMSCTPSWKRKSALYLRGLCLSEQYITNTRLIFPPSFFQVNSFKVPPLSPPSLVPHSLCYSSCLVQVIKSRWAPLFSESPVLTMRTAFMSGRSELKWQTRRGGITGGKKGNVEASWTFRCCEVSQREQGYLSVPFTAHAEHEQSSVR